MKKNEYLSPEVEVVEIIEQCNILAGSNGDNTGNNAGGDGGDDLGGWGFGS